MTKHFIFIILSLSLTIVSAQDAKQYYDKGLELAQQGDAAGAIKYFDQSIALKPDEYVAWYNRGVAKIMIQQYDNAIPDFDQTIMLSPGYKKAYINRGSARKHTADYDGAMADYNMAIRLDTMYGEAYYNRGILYDLLNERIKACMDFERSMKLGYKNGKTKMEQCYKRPTADASIHPILYLTKAATDNQYGYTEAHPVKVGNGPEGGPANERKYLELLRDPTGAPVKFEHQGTCCPYKSEHALFGTEAQLDKYQLRYLQSSGDSARATIYMSFFDYEEPLILSGFKTIEKK